MTERSLVQALADLPIAYPDVPEIDLGAIRQRRPARWVRWVPAAATLVILLVLGFVAPVREAVADWLGLGVVRIERVHEIPTGLGEELDLGAPIDLDGTVPSVAKGLIWPVGLGPPDAAFGREGESSYVWLPSDGLPEVGSTSIGALLTRFESVDDASAEKAIGTGSSLEVVSIDGVRAFWIEGAPHSFVYLDEEGNPITETARVAGNTLLWVSASSTWRFESGLGLDGVVELLEVFGGEALDGG